MTDFDSVLAAAQQLPNTDRLRLIDALWDSVPADADAPFSAEWTEELRRRIEELDAGSAATVPWTTVRDMAMERISRDKAS